MAVFDSGINAHGDLDTDRIVASVDFTSGSPRERKRGSVPKVTGGRWEVEFTDFDSELHFNPDVHGHGTAVAGIVGGSGQKSEGLYSGVAPGVEFVSVKVVGANGFGRTSHLIKAIDWVIAHRDIYNIRVANLSLGHPAIESYTTDPLCQAVERMVSAGIVTVASAGNTGKTDRHSKIWRAINSPANDPAMITVYPANTKGTASHADDVATSYGSRGPTYIDNFFKPDLAAPGNLIPTLLVPGSSIARDHTDLGMDSHYIRLSGASMATAFVTGTVALMLQANPDLSPNMVKVILLVTAIKLEQLHMLEQGNGLLNTLTAVRLAGAVDMDKRRILHGVSPTWCLGEEEVRVGGAFAFGDRIVYSKLLDVSEPTFWGSGLTRSWTDSIFWTD